MDPFKIRTGWFSIDFSKMFVQPSNTLTSIQFGRAQATINCLKLNDDDALVYERLTWVIFYRDSNISIEDLRTKAPFIAFELERQDLQDKQNLHTIIKHLQ